MAEGQLGSLVISLQADIARFREDMGKAQKSATDASNNMARSFDGASASVKRSMDLIGGAVTAGGVMAFTKSLLDAGLQMEKMNKLFSAASGSANLGAREFEYIKLKSEEMGLSVQTAAQSYGKFLAAIKGTTLEGEAGRKVFESVSAATSVLGLSAEETNRAFIALQQMMGKGKVAAEEIRGQWAEVIPGGFKMAADAMGVTQAEFGKMMEQGKVMSDDLLPKLAEQLDKTYRGAAAEGAKGAQAEINRFNNAMTESKAVAGEALLPVFTDIVKFITPALSKVKEITAAVQIFGVQLAANAEKRSTMWDNLFSGRGIISKEGLARQRATAAEADKRAQEQIDEILGNKFGSKSTGYTDTEKAAQSNIKRQALLTTSPTTKAKEDSFTTDSPGFMGWKRDAEMLKEESKWIANFIKEQEAALGSMSEDSPGFMGWRREMDMLKEESEYIKGLSEQMSAEATQRYQEVLMLQEEVRQKSPWLGMKDAIEEYAESVKKVGDQYSDMATGAIQHMEDAIVQFAMTGKANFRDMANSIIADLIRIQARQAMSGMLQEGIKFVGGLAAAYFGGGGDTGATPGADGVSLSSAGYNWQGPSFDVGTNYVPQDMIAKVHQGEAIIPAEMNRAGAMGGAPNVTVNVVNKGSQQAKAGVEDVKFDIKGMVIDIWLDDYNRNGATRQTLAGAVGG